MADVRELFWRQVTEGDFFCVERSRDHTPRSGGGQTYFDIPFGNIDKRQFGRFLGRPPRTIVAGKLPVVIDVGVLGEPHLRADMEFTPRVKNGSTDRYRIARQNRQRPDQIRHPAWRAARGFPKAPDDVPAKTDPSMPDLSLLKLIVARCDDGSHYADYVNAGSPPPGTPAALNVLFAPNRKVKSAELIALPPGTISEAELAAIVHRAQQSSGEGTPTAPEIEDARDAVARGAGRRSRRGGQGFRQSAADRNAIDRHAMALATAHLEKAGWKVTDVSATHSYDLRCRRARKELHVEVKGTTSGGESVILTPNEVDHAREVYPDVALLIVHDVVLEYDADARPLAGGGKILLIDPWNIDAEGTLKPTGFTYTRH
jgi:hypothetical protein